LTPEIVVMNTKNQSRLNRSGKGFTLIEVMIVVAIMSILLMIAIPTYVGYRTRARVAEGVNAVAPVLTRVTEHFLSTGTWPQDNADAALHAPTVYQTKYVARIIVNAAGVTPSNGAVTVEYRNIPRLGSDNTLVFAPTQKAGAVDWECRGGTMADEFRPSTCK
jgi:type IV pilus assembly protein PilA